MSEIKLQFQIDINSVSKHQQKRLKFRENEKKRKSWENFEAFESLQNSRKQKNWTADNGSLNNSSRHGLRVCRDTARSSWCVSMLENAVRFQATCWLWFPIAFYFRARFLKIVSGFFLSFQISKALGTHLNLHVTHFTVLIETFALQEQWTGLENREKSWTANKKILFRFFLTSSCPRASMQCLKVHVFPFLQVE